MVFDWCLYHYFQRSKGRLRKCLLLLTTHEACRSPNHGMPRGRSRDEFLLGLMTWPRRAGNSTRCWPTTRKSTVAVHVACPDAPLGVSRAVVFLDLPSEVQLTIAVRVVDRLVFRFTDSRQVRFRCKKAQRFRAKLRQRRLSRNRTFILCLCALRSEERRMRRKSDSGVAWPTPEPVYSPLTQNRCRHRGRHRGRGDRPSRLRTGR